MKSNIFSRPQDQSPFQHGAPSSSSSRSKKRSSAGSNNNATAAAFTLSGGVSVTAIQEHTANNSNSNSSHSAIMRGAPSGGGPSPIGTVIQPKVDLFIRTDNVSLIPIDHDMKAKLRCGN